MRLNENMSGLYGIRQAPLKIKKSNAVTTAAAGGNFSLFEVCQYIVY